MRFILIFPKTVAIWVLFCLFSSPLQAQSANDAPTILILGDSISAAYNMEISQSWPSLLQDRLQQDGYTYEVFNSSITGETTQGGVTRLPRLLDRLRPEIVVVELGGNDGLRGLPIEVTQQNLSSIIEQSRQAGARVVLAEMRIPPNYGRSYTEKFNQTYTMLQETHGVTLLPFILQDIALEPGMMQADGIHPSIEAQPVILDKVWAVLRTLL
jgi:acyl-CoA thioesterase-1